MQNQQISFFEPINDKELRKVLVNELKHYKALKVKLENKKESKDEGISNLFPSLKNTDTISEFKVRLIEKALGSSLDVIERKIIELKYLSLSEINDLDIYLELGIKKGKFYLKKRTAIYNLATALGII